MRSLEVFEIQLHLVTEVTSGRKSHFSLYSMYLQLPASVRAESDTLSGCNSTSCQQMETESVFLQTEKPDILPGQHLHYYIFQRWSGQNQMNYFYLRKLVLLSISERTDLAGLAWGMFILNTSSHLWNVHSGALVCLLTCQSLPPPLPAYKESKSHWGSG